jgi:diacylglycerol kinase (ATP)
MKIAAIVNGISKGRAACIEALRQQDVDIDIRVTKAVGDAQDLSYDLSKAGEVLILCCGGDGTLNECINGIMKSGCETIKLGLYPIGSANDYARLFPYHSIQELVQLAANDAGNSHDIVKISFDGNHRFLANISACGIGAEIAATVNARRFKMNPTLNYYSGIVSWLMKYQAPLIRIQMDDVVLEQRCFLAAIGKGKYAGNGLGLLPQTVINEGKLGVSLIGDVNVFDFIRYQGRLKKGQKIVDSRVHYHRCKSASLEVIDGVLALETDGEFYARLEAGHKVHFEIVESSISFVY